MRVEWHQRPVKEAVDPVLNGASDFSTSGMQWLTVNLENSFLADRDLGVCRFDWQTLVVANLTDKSW